MKQTRRRTASVTTLLALLLSGVVPIAAFAVEEPIGPTGSFEAPANANETTVCEELGEVLGLGSLEQAKRVNWPPEETTASTDELDGFPYLVLKSGQVYEYFSFPAGYDRELLANGAETSFAISNITGCAFEEAPVLELELVKVWDVPEGLDVDLSGVASLTVDGAAVGSPVVVDAGATYPLGESVDEEALAALLPEACAWVEDATSAMLDGEPFDFPGDLLVPTDVTEDTTYVLEVTNVIDCADVAEVVIERGPDPEPEPEVTPTVEVLDVTQTAVALPETGAPAILLALLGLVSMMLGGGMLTTRRRE
ncbi:MAG: LPXTG cell wall anchor domain-containing protein [Nitriliruptoraceae bacterium]